ncbi:MAG TPA: HAD family hydrolase [Dehalococcoidia bacterium]|nr:HAD family hydrolase [Dehalococcoidia bacterium]HIK88187.1 HAD family hydrolase [Dehalococcoidia bacterium]
MLETLCAEKGVEVSDSLISDLVEERRGRLDLIFENIDETIIDMIQRTKSIGLSVAVVSNASDTDVDGWFGSWLADEVEHFVTSFDVGVMKPEPLIYRRAMDLLGVEASEVVWVGDGSYSELAGAQNVGITPLWAT